MKNKLIAALILTASLGFVAASSGPRAPVEVGKSYVIATTDRHIEGKVTAVLGNGWWKVEEAGGKVVDVNVMAAAWVTLK